MTEGPPSGIKPLMKFSPIFLLTATLICLNVWAGPNSRDCEYYKDVEARFLCGRQGYPINYGYRMCNLYLRQQHSVSPGLRQWFPKVRYCLQKYLHNNQTKFHGCQDLKAKALRSHVGCYVKTGFCALSWSDRLTIVRSLEWGVFSRDVLAQAYAVQQACP
jgi:hypothetical protein